MARRLCACTMSSRLAFAPTPRTVNHCSGAGNAIFDAENDTYDDTVLGGIPADQFNIVFRGPLNAGLEEFNKLFWRSLRRNPGFNPQLIYDSGTFNGTPVYSLGEDGKPISVCRPGELGGARLLKMVLEELKRGGSNV